MTDQRPPIEWLVDGHGNGTPVSRAAQAEHNQLIQERDELRAALRHTWEDLTNMAHVSDETAAEIRKHVGRTPPPGEDES